MEITNRITGYIARTKVLWMLFKPMVKFSSGIIHNRKINLNKKYIDELKTIFKDLKVMNGPFKGMVYPDFNSFGSQIFPKLLGSYESELNKVWEEVLNKNYQKIIDVGSAEGYFSVGLALKSKSNCEILAVDVSPKALEMCQKIAKLNRVSDRINYLLGIDADGLNQICKNRRCFILCDSEGFEKQLFTQNNVQSLSYSDILIETHDSKVFGVSNYLYQLLSKTHDVERIYSIDDIQKFNNYSYIELDKVSEEARLIALSEKRSNIQEWFYCKPKSLINSDI